MNKEQQDLLDEAYENYLNNFIEPVCPPNLDVQPSYYEPMTKEWFIKSTKENNSRGQEFSKKWKLKIEERELSLSERTKYKKERGDRIARTFAAYTHQMLDNANIPTRLITVTYTDKTIESYE